MSVKDRRHFRIRYPQDALPSLVVNKYTFLIQDLSESGLKFLCAEEVPVADSVFDAEIHFFSKTKYRCKCKVVRIVSKSVMVTFDKEIPKKILEVEAQKLLDAYGRLETTKF
ncbi:MAG: PilZ domain-containing protein [Oligoflexales bacterium]